MAGHSSIHGGKRARLHVVGAMAVLVVVIAAGFVACTPPGDQEIWLNGGDLAQPSGYARVNFRSIGTDPLVGQTTVTADVDSGPLRFTNAAYFPIAPPGGSDSLTGTGPEISPDGKHLTYHLDGTTPTTTRELRVYFTDNFFLQPSSYRITFTHPDDTNPANDTITITTGPAPPG